MLFQNKINLSYCASGWFYYRKSYGRVQLKCDGTRWLTGGELKEKLTKGVGSQYSYTTSEYGVSSITTADAHSSAASSRLNWRPRRFKWTRPFRRKTKSGFCACAITFQTQPTYLSSSVSIVWAVSANESLSKIIHVIFSDWFSARGFRLKNATSLIHQPIPFADGHLLWRSHTTFSKKHLYTLTTNFHIWYHLACDILRRHFPIVWW